MRILIIIGFLILLCGHTPMAFADNNSSNSNTTNNNSVTANYPAPLGSYNKVQLVSPVQGANGTGTNVDCSKTQNTGLLFMDVKTQTLQMCVNGTTTAVPYPETCFNRFCSFSCVGQCSRGASFNEAEPAGLCLSTGAPCTYSYVDDNGATQANGSYGYYQMPAYPCYFYGCPMPNTLDATSSMNYSYMSDTSQILYPGSSQQQHPALVDNVFSSSDTSSSTYYYVRSTTCCNNNATVYDNNKS